MDTSKLMSIEAWKDYAVNRPGQYEVLKQPLYDYNTYAQAGQTLLTYFQNPVGQGTKTVADTNMESAGQLPNPKRFLIRGIEIFFTPGVFPSAAPAAASIDNYVNDVFEVFTGAGVLNLFIGSKTYVQAPINMFPAATRLAGWTGMASQAAVADVLSRTTYASSSGTPFGMDPPLILEPTQNFSVTCVWPTAIGISANARMGVHLKGLLYRQSQ